MRTKAWMDEVSEQGVLSRHFGFTTTHEDAARIIAIAEARGVTISRVIREWVAAGLEAAES